MVRPIDVIPVIHNALRADMAAIDGEAFAAARGTPGLILTEERLRFFNEILGFHAQGEELGIFPALEAVAPLVAASYAMEHRGLDNASLVLGDAISVHDKLRTARASAAFKFHLDLHLAKEETHLYPIFQERVSVPDQAQAVRLMVGVLPPERHPEFIAWMFPLLGNDDRETMIRIWQMGMPDDIFAATIPLVRESIADSWGEVTRRIPELEEQSSDLERGAPA